MSLLQFTGDGIINAFAFTKSEFLYWLSLPNALQNIDGG